MDWRTVEDFVDPRMVSSMWILGFCWDSMGSSEGEMQSCAALGHFALSSHMALIVSFSFQVTEYAFQHLKIES